MNKETHAFQKLCHSEQSIAAGRVLGRSNGKIESIYIVKDGLLSVTVPLSSGGEVATAMIGPGGVAGAMSAFGCPYWFNTVLAQTAGSVWVVNRSDFTAAVRDDASLQKTAFQHEMWISLQAQQAAACNAVHPLPARMSTWLLTAQDLTGWKEFHFTHEYISEMLGAQRVSISNAAIEMRQKGLIEYRRGNVSVQDRSGLEGEACECYLATKAAHHEIFRW